VTALYRAKQVADWARGELLRGRPDAAFTGTSIDSRTVGAGELFVAIRGPQHDGHDHLAAAAERGAAGVLVERGRALPPELAPEIAVVAADDTTRALGELAAGHRAGFRGPVVAITGSNGKTTTKEMCAAILAADAPCLKNEGNLNNQYGLPLTLLRRAPEHRRVCVEIGMNHRGEIAALAAIAAPTVGVLTNVGTAHIEHLGSREAIATEKGDLLAALPEDGVAVVNADDALARAQAERTRARVLRFGTGPDADVRTEEVRGRDGRGFAFVLCAPAGRIPVEVDGVGESTLWNALAASAAALAAGAPAGAVARGLASYRAAPGRLRPREVRGVLVLDDSYNANPQSMAVAMQSLAALRREGRAFAALGAMGELGAEAEPAHRELGREAARLGLSGIVALGEHAEAVAAGARDAGLPEARARVAADHADAARAVSDWLRPGDRVLVKGSRAARMERVVALLLEGTEDGEA